MEYRTLYQEMKEYIDRLESSSLNINSKKALYNWLSDREEKAKKSNTIKDITQLFQEASKEEFYESELALRSIFLTNIKKSQLIKTLFPIPIDWDGSIAVEFFFKWLDYVMRNNKNKRKKDIYTQVNNYFTKKP